MSDKKKSGSWKDLFIKSDEVEEDKVEEPAPKHNPVINNAPVQSYNPPPVSSSNSNAFEAKLKETIGNQSSEYVKFKRAVDDLKTVIDDENTRIKSTFVSMRVLGITKEILVSAAKASHHVVSKEKDEFEAAMKAAYLSQVDGAANKINSLNSQIESKVAQISSLQAEVDRMRLEKDKLSSGIEQNKLSIEAAQRDFSVAYNKVCEEINSDINKINSNL